MDARLAWTINVQSSERTTYGVGLAKWFAQKFASLSQLFNQYWSKCLFRNF